MARDDFERDREADCESSREAENASAHAVATENARAENTGNPPAETAVVFEETRKRAANVLAENECSTDRQVRDFAQEHGMIYVDARGHETAHEDFVRLQWTPHRRENIEVAQSHLAGSNAVFGELLVADEGLLSEKRIAALIRERISFPWMIEEELEGIESLCFGVASKMRGGLTKEDFVRHLKEELMRARTKYSYGIQYKYDVYKSIGIVPESLFPFLGMSDLRELLVKDDMDRGRVLRSVVDFGCGDGYLLKLWDEAVRGRNRRVGKFRQILSATTKIKDLDDRLKFLTHLRGTHACDESDRVYSKRERRRAILGIDLSRETVADLERHGIRGKALDISAPWREFSGSAKIRPASRDIVLTSYTLDRTHNPDQQLQNMSAACALGGRIIVISKTELDPRADGWQGRTENKQRRPQYSNTDLRSGDKITLLKKLKERMGQYGCRMTAVGRHPTKVICADCNTGNGGGPQNYSSLMMVFEKVADTTPLPRFRLLLS